MPQAFKKFGAFVVIRHRIAEAIKKVFGVCLVSIIGEHQRDYREPERL
jgi:hypothetical protein